MNPLLRTRGLTVQFGGVHALTDVDVTIGEGELLGLIGPNGAGKTTFIDAVTGFVASTGRVELSGRDITGLSAHRRARRGITRTFQSLELFDDLTVAENVAAPLERPTAMSLLRDLARPQSIRLDTGVGAALELLGLTDLAYRLPTELSHGQRRLAACARAVAGSPALICMDEPAAGLDNTESAMLGGHLRTIAASGSAILLVDHDMSMVFETCDRVVVIDFGRIIADGTPDEVRRDPAVVAAYLGRSMERGQP